eukprot:s1256_g7.t1
MSGFGVAMEGAVVECFGLLDVLLHHDFGGRFGFVLGADQQDRSCGRFRGQFQHRHHGAQWDQRASLCFICRLGSLRSLSSNSLAAQGDDDDYDDVPDRGMGLGMGVPMPGPGREALKVKNTFLDFETDCTPLGQRLRPICSAAGRLDALGDEEEMGWRWDPCFFLDGEWETGLGLASSIAPVPSVIPNSAPPGVGDLHHVGGLSPGDSFRRRDLASDGMANLFTVKNTQLVRIGNRFIECEDGWGHFTGWKILEKWTRDLKVPVRSHALRKGPMLCENRRTQVRRPPRSGRCTRRQGAWIPCGETRRTALTDSDQRLKKNVIRPTAGAKHVGTLNAERKGKVTSYLFVLYEDSLDRHDSEDDFRSGQEPRGSQLLSAIERLTVKDNRFIIEVRNQKKPLELFLDDAKEFKQWTQAFQQVLAKSLGVQPHLESLVSREGELMVKKKSKEESRYCVLRTDYFQYFLTEAEYRAGAVARCHALMEDITDFQVEDKTIKVSLGDKSIEMRATTMEDLKRWERAWNTEEDMPQAAPAASAPMTSATFVSPSLPSPADKLGSLGHAMRLRQLCGCLRPATKSAPPEDQGANAPQPSQIAIAVSSAEMPMPPRDGGHKPATRIGAEASAKPQRPGGTSQQSGSSMDRPTNEVERALMYLSRSLDETWISQHDDVAYYFRLPVAFMEAGREAEARRALDIAARYVRANRVSSKKLTMIYPQYSLLWICEAAARLGQGELAENLGEFAEGDPRRCVQAILRYRHPLTSSGIISEPYTWNENYEADFFATAVLAKAAILSGQESLAVAAANSLLRAVDANRRYMASGRFFLRWTWADGFVENDEDPLYCVTTSGEQQLYFLLGLPTAVLLEVANSFRSMADSAKEKYRAVANELLLYLKRCKNFFTASTAYGTACAAAMLGDQESMSCMLSFQQKDGSFNGPLTQLDILEHTAEISTCLCRMSMLGATSSEGYPSGSTSGFAAGNVQTLPESISDEESEGAIPDELPERARDGFSILADAMGGRCRAQSLVVDGASSAGAFFGVFKIKVYAAGDVIAPSVVRAAPHQWVGSVEDVRRAVSSFNHWVWMGPQYGDGFDFKEAGREAEPIVFALREGSIEIYKGTDIEVLNHGSPAKCILVDDIKDLEVEEEQEKFIIRLADRKTCGGEASAGSLGQVFSPQGKSFDDWYDELARVFEEAESGRTSVASKASSRKEEHCSMDLPDVAPEEEAFLAGFWSSCFGAATSYMQR